MTEHELTPCGYASSVVAGCLIGFYRKDEGQALLNKVMSNHDLRRYVPDEDVEELKTKGYKIVGVKK